METLNPFPCQRKLRKTKNISPITIKINIGKQTTEKIGNISENRFLVLALNT